MCYIFVLLVVFLAPSCLILDLLFPNDSFHFLSWHEAIYRDFLVRPSACMHVSMSDSYFSEMRRKSKMKGRRLVKRCFESLEGAQKGVEFLFLIPEFESPFLCSPRGRIIVLRF